MNWSQRFDNQILRCHYQKMWCFKRSNIGTSLKKTVSVEQVLKQLVDWKKNEQKSNWQKVWESINSLYLFIIFIIVNKF